jgi:hypothetical protein
MMKIIPIAVMATGIATSGAYGKQFVERVTQKVKVLVTGMEVRSIGQELKFYFLSCGSVPGGTQEEFSEFVRENMESALGNRDTSKDLFGEPYRLEHAEGDIHLVYSTGPNGHPDECMLFNGEAPDISPPPPDADRPELDQETAAASLPAHDDICVALELAIRDTPFRPIPK